MSSTAANVGAPSDPVARVRRLLRERRLLALYAGYSFKMVNTTLKSGLKRVIMARVRENVFAFVLVIIVGRTRKHRTAAGRYAPQILS